MDIHRRSILRQGGAAAVGGLVGLTGCLGRREADTTVEATVVNKWLRIVHDAPPEPSQEGAIWVAIIGPYDFDREWIEKNGEITSEMLDWTDLSSWVEEETSFSEDDLDPDVDIADFPMDEIYAAREDLEFRRTYIFPLLDLKTDDDVNGIDAAERQGYSGPTEFFDHLEPGARYTFRVAESEEFYQGYYPSSGFPRIIEILD